MIVNNDNTVPQTSRCKIIFKLSPTDVTAKQIKRTRAEEDVTTIGELLPRRPTTNSSFNTPDVVSVIDNMNQTVMPVSRSNSH